LDRKRDHINFHANWFLGKRAQQVGTTNWRMKLTHGRSHVTTNLKELINAANAAVPQITPAQAQEQEMIAQGNTLVVDVREAPEVEKSGKVAGAVNVSRSFLEFRADPDSPSHDKNFTKDKNVIVYCGSGGRAALSGKTLKDMGYDRVYNLGGFKDWVDSGRPVEKVGEPGK
jgi:rhodanese-related sulfurtransferase